MSLQLEGMQSLMAELHRLENQMSKEISEKALLEGAEIYKEAAILIAPERTGNLKNNIIVSKVKEDNTVDIGPNQQGDAFYGYFLEFGRSAGTRRTGKKKGYKYPAMAARPFMGPTFENHKAAVQQKMADVIKGELRI
jgi:HK97 gp10 family phage protein